MTCLNCESEIEGNYCANCGQKTSVKQITMQSLMENLLVGISNLDKGFLYNIKELSIRPGKTIMDYHLSLFLLTGVTYWQYKPRWNTWLFSFFTLLIEFILFTAVPATVIWLMGKI